MTNAEQETRKSFPITIWSGLITAEHRKRMGSAIWVLLWFIDKTTREENGRGYVLGGKPITNAEIGEALEMSERAVRDALTRLIKFTYIEAVRAPAGLRVIVLKSKKRLLKGTAKNYRSDRQEAADQGANYCRSGRQETADQPAENRRSLNSHDMYKDSTKDRSIDMLEKRAYASLYEELDSLSEEEYSKLAEEAVKEMAKMPLTRAFLVATPDGYILPPDQQQSPTHRLMMRSILARRKKES